MKQIKLDQFVKIGEYHYKVTGTDSKPILTYVPLYEVPDHEKWPQCPYPRTDGS